jgi:hypothetical protein
MVGFLGAIARFLSSLMACSNLTIAHLLKLPPFLAGTVAVLRLMLFNLVAALLVYCCLAFDFTNGRGCCHWLT